MNQTNYINRIREFNRFYTVLLGIVNKKYIGNYSMTEARIIYELRMKPNCGATEIIDKLKLDKGYLSRILKKFVNDGLLQKSNDSKDGRAFCLNLTPQGIAEADNLIEQSNKRMADLLKGYNEGECAEICEAMDTITKYFSAGDKYNE